MSSNDSYFPKKGEDDFLTREETAFLQRLLSRPEAFPQQFWSAVIQKVALDGLPIPQSQVQGLSQSKASYATVLTQESTTSTTWANLATVGPTLTGLSNGTYLALFGCVVLILGVADGAGLMSLSVNGAAPSENDRLTVQTAVSSGTVTINQSSMRATVLQLDNENNNSLTAKYRNGVAGTVDYYFRWLVALKIGN